MKKTSKPAPKKAVAKKPAAKKSSSMPKRKAAGQGDLAQVLDRIASDQGRIIDQQGKIIGLVEQLVAMVGQLVELEEAREPAEGTGQPAVSDDVARMAQWLCLNCNGIFPGEDLFDRGSTGERVDRCPTCGSDNIAIPERIKDTNQDS
jgi:hypothetical protein